MWARGPGLAAPCLEDKDVVDRETGNGVDAAGLDLVDLGEKPREMGVRADRRKRSRHRKEHHPFAAKDLGDGENLDAVPSGRLELACR